MLILYDKYFAAWATTVALLGSVCMSPVKSAPPCGCKLTGLLCSICEAGSWTALEGLAGCAGRQTVPDKPGRKTRQREVHFELVRFKRLTVWLWLADQLNNEWSTEEEKKIKGCNQIWQMDQLQELKQLCLGCMFSPFLLQNPFLSNVLKEKVGWKEFIKEDNRKRWTVL